MDGTRVTAFEASSRFFVEVVKLVPGTAWQMAGIGTWTMRELVAHANRSHTLIEEYLLRPRPPEPAGSGYFGEEAVAERGREAVSALGDDPGAAVVAASEHAISLVAGTAPDATVGSPAGTTTLAAYLPSRTAELTIHGLDILRALSRPDAAAAKLPVSVVAPPPEALAESLRFLVERLVRRGDGEVALLALSGRAELPPGFSAY